MMDINKTKHQQQTISKTIEVSGIGLHSGLEVNLKMIEC